MLRSLHLLLGFGVVSPFLLQCKPRSLVALPTIAALSNPQGLSFSLPIARSRSDACFRTFWMASSSSGDSETSYAVDAASGPAVAQPVVHKPKVSFCQACGNPTKQIIPDGEEKIRAVCTVCGRIHYENPKMVVGCLVEHDDKVLLCKRKIEPSYGLWTLPAGYLEIGESAAEGACRETLEEACAEVEVLSPFAQLDIPRIGQYRVTSYSEQD